MLLFLLFASMQVTAKNPYCHLDAPAYVKVGTSLCKKECDYLCQRMPRVRKALEDLLGHAIGQNQLPVIALCMSGGGYRAMTANLGSLIALNECGLLDAITYASAISGSTWLLAPLIISGMQPREYKEHLTGRIKDSLFSGTSNKQQLLKHLFEKFTKTGDLSIVDLYGGLLAQKLLRFDTKNPHDYYLHSDFAVVETGATVYPLFTTAIDEKPYKFIEFGIHEIGCDYLNCFTPSWALGRTFASGMSTTTGMPCNLGYLLGVWGSAFNIYWEEFILNLSFVLDGESTFGMLFKLFKDYIARVKIKPSYIPNFSYRLFSDPIHEQTHLALIDAGIYCNLPLEPLLRKERKVDIIIMLDCSAQIEGAPYLVESIEHAKLSGFDLPDPTPATKKLTHLTVLAKNNCPTIIYMPCIKNDSYDATFDPYEIIKHKGFCRTTNFVYTKEQVDQLSGLAEFTLKEHKAKIIEVIEQVITRKAE